MRQILVIFPEAWLGYSPTVLNLISMLGQDCSVRVVAFDDGNYDNSALSADPRIVWVRLTRWQSKTLALFGVHARLKAHLLVRAARAIPADVVVGVDSIGLWCGLQVAERVHFVSLEIKRDRFFRDAPRERIASVSIQSHERYEFLFGDTSLPTHFLANAPLFHGTPPDPRPGGQWRAVYFGNAIPRHGVYLCIDALRGLPEVKLTIKGRIPRPVRRRIESTWHDLLAGGRLVLDDRYVEQEDVVPFLADFHVGFCFYDFSLIARADFNYLSSPAGKLFAYYAAGVPVIGSDILGLRSVQDFDAGRLLAEPSPEAIGEAVTAVLGLHGQYRRNALRAARHFDFRRSAAGLVNELCTG